MKIVSDSDLPALGWMVWRERPGAWIGTFLVKTCWKLAPSQDRPEQIQAQLSGDVGDPACPEPGSRAPSDIVPFKPRADVMISGTCHRPGGKPGLDCRVTARIGSFSKTLRVVGDRIWTRSLVGVCMSDPQPFVSMPLGWERSFGGEGYGANPSGRGIGGDVLPNIEDPDQLIRSPEDRPAPAGFGPVPLAWSRRLKKAGTYDREWLQEQWPWYPRNIDWGFFNSAREDQQLPYLRGDEELLFENMHPVHSVYHSRLPAVRTRLFIQDRMRDQERFREVPLNLDTLWVDMDEERLTLVGRGRIEVQSFKLEEVDFLYVAQEPLAQMQAGVERHRADFQRAIHTPEEVPEPEPPPMAEPDLGAQMDAEEDKARVALEESEAKLEADADATVKEAKKRLQEGGQDPARLDVQFVPYDPTRLRAQIDQAIEQALKLRPELEPQLQEFRSFELPELGQMGESPATESPEGAGLPWTRERVLAAVSRGESLAEQDLSRLDLSKCDLRGGRFPGARLAGANLSKTNLANGDFSGAVLSEADLTETNLSGAMLNDADLSQAVLSHACLREASLSGATFEKGVAPGADFRGAKGHGCSFAGANLDTARFGRAELPSSDFEEGSLAAADFSHAILVAAQFERVRAPGIVMTGADLTGLHASGGSDFSGGDFRSVHARKSTWQESVLDRARFGGSDLERADFTGASLVGADLAGVRLEAAVFDDSTLNATDCRRAWMVHGSFQRADLTGADLRGANCYEAEFWDAKTGGVRLDGAFLEGTKLWKESR